MAKPKIPLPLLPEAGETPAEHRAFLLYGMTIPSKRGRLRRVGAAVGRNESTLRHWHKTRTWDARLSVLGGDAEMRAAEAYHIQYNLERGDTEVKAIAAMMRVPYRPPPSVMREEASKPIEEAAESLHEAARSKHKEQRGKLVKLTDAMMSYIAEMLKNKKVRVTAGDILTLAKASNLLAFDPYEDAGTTDTGPRVVESVRIRLARQQGTDILEAAQEDAEELALILRTLRMGRAGLPEGETVAREDVG